MQYREEILNTEDFRVLQRKFSKHILAYFENPEKPLMDFEGLKEHNAHLIPLDEMELHIMYATCLQLAKNAMNGLLGKGQPPLTREVINKCVSEWIYKHISDDRQGYSNDEK